MMMMGQEEVGSDQTQIIKGKRTKRQRSSSSTFVVAAATTTVTSTSSSAIAGGGGGRTGSEEYNSAVSSPISTDDCTEEEEDMAICLIMLARGAVSSPSPDLKNSRKHEKIHNSSFYVYECKTCNRTFPSFQALGGHRASHKKPRITSTAVEKTRLPLMNTKSSSSEEGQNGHLKVSGSALASQASKGNKVHECSICGSEFTSGQALGGHMRRHRVTATTTTTAVAAEVEIENNMGRSMEKRKYLPLDLNLPAPEDDLKYQGIVFTATPALIDCHY